MHTPAIAAHILHRKRRLDSIRVRPLPKQRHGRLPETRPWLGGGRWTAAVRELRFQRSWCAYLHNALDHPRWPAC